MVLIGGFQFETIYSETIAEDTVAIIEIPEVKEPLPKYISVQLIKLEPKLKT